MNQQLIVYGIIDISTIHPDPFEAVLVTDTVFSKSNSIKLLLHCTM